MADYIENPHVTLLFEPKEGPVESIRILAPIRKQSLRTTIVNKSEPGFYGALLQKRIADQRGWPFDPPSNLKQRFVDAGLLVPEEQLPHPVTYRCDLTEDLLPFVPRRPPAIHPNGNASASILNPSIEYLADSKGGSLNLSGSAQTNLKLVAHFLQPDRYWYLIHSPKQYAPRLYSLNEEQHHIVQNSTPGEAVGSNMDPALHKLFFEAEILVTCEHLNNAAVAGEKSEAACADELHSKRYTIKRSIFHPFQSASIRRYYRELIDEGFLRFGDESWPLRFYTPWDSIAYVYQQLTHPLFARITRRIVEPTFLFFASYRPGAELPPHRDRDACEYSSSILLDYVPEPDDVCSWPLYVELLDPPGHEVPVLLGVGDMLLYYGRELKHYRNPFHEGDVSTTWLFFFQPASQSST